MLRETSSVGTQTTTSADYVKHNEKIADPGILAGRRIATPAVGEEIVISGMSGRLPNSDNLNVFMDNLINKVEMMDSDTRRWVHSHPEIPRMAGKINKVNKMDAGFFGVHHLHSIVMDPMIRILLEVTYEAICDAGLTLEELKGSRTGVFVAVCASDTENVWMFEKLIPKGNSVTGCVGSMFANQVSYFFQFEGPSHVINSACSSSLSAVEHAYKAIRENRCDNAVVGATSLCLHPYSTLQYARLGALSMNGGCRVFDEDADGYTRSEAICAIFLQRAMCAKRLLAKIIHGKINSDGFKELGITYPSADTQKNLLDEVYKEANLSPNDVTFFESHGTGTKAGDPEELKSISSIFCQARPTTLFIGSVKSNMGHSEGASGLCSLIKVVLGMEAEVIPPNINFRTPRKGIGALEEGRIKVVTDTIPWPDNRAVVGINNLGFGGVNAHLVLEWNKKTTSIYNILDNDIPKLVCVSSRVQEGVQALLDEVANKEYNIEFIKLIHDAFSHCISTHDQRGFSIRSKSGEVHREVTYCEEKFPDFYCLFGDVIKNIGTVLHEISRIAEVTFTTTKVTNILHRKKLMPPTNNKSIYDDIISTITFQIILVDLMRNIGLEIKNVYGHAVGELTCAFHTKFLTLEQTIMCCHYIALAKSSSDYSKLEEQLKNVILPLSIGSDKWVSSFISKLTSVESLLETISKAPKKLRVCVLDVGFLDAVNLRVAKVVQFEFGKNNSVVALLVGFGRLYNMGQNFIVSKLYPEVAFPVSRGTPLISPLIKWNHKKDWFVYNFNTTNFAKPAYYVITMNPNDNYWRFIASHVIDGRILFPASGYLFMVWMTFSAMLSKTITELKVVFENVKFLRTTICGKETITSLITIHKSTGLFEVNEGGAAIATGRIFIAREKVDEILILPKSLVMENACLLKEDDVYRELRLRGYQYQGVFKGIEEYYSSTAKVKWQNNWVSFIDCMVQVMMLEEDCRNHYVSIGIDRIVIDAPKHIQYVERTSAKIIEVHNYKGLNMVKSEYIEIRGVHFLSIPTKKSTDNPILQSYEFVPNQGTYSLEDAIQINVQIMLENNPTLKFKAVEISNDVGGKTLATYVDFALSDEPLVQLAVTTLSVNGNNLTSQVGKNNFLVMGYDLLRDKVSIRKCTGTYAAVKQFGNGYDQNICGRLDHTCI